MLLYPLENGNRCILNEPIPGYYICTITKDDESCEIWKDKGTYTAWSRSGFYGYRQETDSCETLGECVEQLLIPLR